MKNKGKPSQQRADERKEREAEKPNDPQSARTIHRFDRSRSDEKGCEGLNAGPSHLCRGISDDEPTSKPKFTALQSAQQWSGRELDGFSSNGFRLWAREHGITELRVRERAHGNSRAWPLERKKSDTDSQTEEYMFDNSHPRRRTSSQP